MESERWVERLTPGHPRRDRTVAMLHEVLLRVAFYALSRRRAQLGAIRGPEFDDLAQQAADDALMNILDRLYKNLFDARRNLRARMAAAGHALESRHAA